MDKEKICCLTDEFDNFSDSERYDEIEEGGEMDEWLQDDNARRGREMQKDFEDYYRSDR